MLFHHQQTRRGKEMEFQVVTFFFRKRTSRTKAPQPLKKKSIKCEEPERKADYRSFFQGLRRNKKSRPDFAFWIKGFAGGHGKRRWSRRNKGLLFVKEMSVRIGERAREKSPSSDIFFPPCLILYAGCGSETKPYFFRSDDGAKVALLLRESDDWLSIWWRKELDRLKEGRKGSVGLKWGSACSSSRVRIIRMRPLHLPMFPKFRGPKRVSKTSCN